MDRPHIIYCEKTGKYVAWLKIMGGDGQFMSILQADDILGPYTYVHERYKALQMDTGDFALAMDEETKKVYFIFDRPHFQIVTATLNDDYTGVTGEYSVHYDNMKVPIAREAPAYFSRGGNRYLFTSGTSGYFPNPSMVCKFTDWHGAYEDLGDPCPEDRTGTTYYGQITCVLKIPGKDLYIAMADRWKPTFLQKAISRHFHKFLGRLLRIANNDISKPDLRVRTEANLSTKELRHFENTSIARYVWLPIEWEGEKPIIRWRDEWRLEDF